MAQKRLQKFDKKGDIAWQTIAAIILALIVLVIIILFSGQAKEKIEEGIRYFAQSIFGR